MKFFLDQNVSRNTADFLRGLKIGAVHASEIGFGSKKDSEIYEFCRKKGLVLVTFDHEFGHEYISKKDLQGLVIIKIHPQTAENVHPALRKFFSGDKEGLEIKGRISIIEKGRVRSRKIKV